MKFLGAMAFAAICVGVMVASVFARTERDRRDPTQNAPLRIAPFGRRA